MPTLSLLHAAAAAGAAHTAVQRSSAPCVPPFLAALSLSLLRVMFDIQTLLWHCHPVNLSKLVLNDLQVVVVLPPFRLTAILPLPACQLIVAVAGALEAFASSSCSSTVCRCSSDPYLKASNAGSRSCAHPCLGRPCQEQQRGRQLQQGYHSWAQNMERRWRMAGDMRPAPCASRSCTLPLLSVS